MNRSHRWLFGALLALGSVVSIADETIGGQINGVPIGQQAAPVQSKAPGTDAERKSCLNQCMMADSKCGSEVRQARQECSRNAANNGRDPFDTRSTGGGDYSYFCAYFSSPVSCTSDRYGCRSRYAQRYNQCLGLMRENVASMRYDCFRGERDAQNLCRTELRDCKTACQ
jgi:hypothetical protein